MGYLTEAVALTRVDHQLRLHTGMAQSPVELVALRNRHPHVLLAVPDQSGRRRLLDEGHRGSAPVRFRFVIGGSAQVQLEEGRGDVGLGMEGEQVGQSAAADGCLEATGLCDRPGGQVAAVTGSVGSQSVRISDAAVDEQVHAGHEIPEVTIAPVLDVSAPKAAP